VLILPHAGEAGPARSAPLADPGGCATKDHLSGDKKRKLQILKNEMRGRDVSMGRVLTSHDCRCIETAGILFGHAHPWSVIDNDRETAAELVDQRRAALTEAVSRWDSDGNLAIVTHQTTISEAFGINMAPAELLLIEPLGDEGFRVVGRLSPD